MKTIYKTIYITPYMDLKLKAYNTMLRAQRQVEYNTDIDSSGWAAVKIFVNCLNTLSDNIAFLISSQNSGDRGLTEEDFDE